MKPITPKGSPRPREWWYATTLLVVVFALYLTTLLVDVKQHWWGVVRAFAEAATIGAIADWFAVVALFQAPLGLNVLVGRFGFLGHLAVLPRRQQQIAETAGVYIESQVLTPTVIAESLREIPVARLVGEEIQCKRDEMGKHLWDALPWLAKAAGAGFAISTIVDRSAEKLTTDEDLQRTISVELASKLETWLSGQPGLVARKVRQRIADIPSEEFVTHAKDMIGRELQFIRINGTLVGGMVGVVLYGIAMVIR